ncbi:MAG: hypothetical protein HRU07_10010 [Nitrosopumilus sp.]|nr:hypothetical protein [Nitrosopumilus sp.]NRA06462.1 hypothetical protein [Nitrosopumilus sp.]
MSEFIQSPLFDSIYKYFSSNKNEKIIFIFVPYIKTKILEKLISDIKSKIVIVTTWDTQDLLAGSSELELYPFCNENGIALYINNKIHLKVYSIGLENAIVATGNISNSGFMPDGNYECGVFVEKLSNKDRLYFEKIRKESRLVDNEIYNRLAQWLEQQTKEPRKVNEFDKIVGIPKKENFLISALPMTKGIFDLVEGYQKLNSGLEPSNDPEISACIYHDLANYNIGLGLTKEKFLEKLKIQFFAHPFIQKIDEFIAPEAYFGRVKEWIQNNCTDVPIPSRRELTENVQVLYEWFKKLGDGKYVIDMPGSHSQRITNVKF